MRKSILKLLTFSFVLGLFMTNFNNNVEAQSDPMGLCPDGAKICARDTANGKVWHKGNDKPVVQNFQ